MPTLQDLKESELMSMRDVKDELLGSYFQVDNLQVEEQIKRYKKIGQKTGKIFYIDVIILYPKVFT